MNMSKELLSDKYPQSRIGRLFTSVAFVSFIALSVVFSILIYLLAAPASGVTSDNLEISSGKKSFSQGEVATFTSLGKYCNYGYTVEITRDFSNGRGFIRSYVAGVYAPPAPYCEEDPVFSSAIPEDLPPGRWQLILRISYKQNPLKNVTITKTSNFFSVTPASAK